MYNPVDTFLQEADDLLAEIEQTALGLNVEDAAGEAVNRLFRAFHTIKGSGAMFGFTEVAAFTHHIESLLDAVREGRAAVSAELAELVLTAGDRIKALLAGGPGATFPPSERGADLVEKIGRLLESPWTQGPSAVAPQPSAGEVAGAANPAVRRWKIRFRPNATMLAHGVNPLFLFRELAELGDCRVTAHADGLPELTSLEPDFCYLWWTAELRTSSDRNAIRDVFIFVEDASELAIEVEGESKPEAKEAGAAAVAQTAKSAPRESSVRVPAARLDRLVGLVGELVMNQSRLAEAASRSGSAELAVPVEEIDRLVAELRDNVLGIRMMPIGTIFGRFRRLVHDLSVELGKDADLVTAGEDTELDKSVLDQLGEPLVHLIRNSIDHGIEPADERAAAGKPRRGTVRLAAVHAGSEVVVSVTDDGRGLDAAAIRAKALEKGLIAADAAIGDREVLNLILVPGFSTARTVTNVSGRGVGMDVVKRQIEALHGSVTLAGETGKGTRISLALPLTLAIIEGLVVEVAAEQFIVPMNAVTENVELDATQRARGNQRNLIAVRGELIPYVDLREAFDLGGTRPAIEKIVIVHQEESRVGLVVDRVLGTHQTVIQPLGVFLRGVDVASGATVMGDGRVAVILDIPGVVDFADRAARRQAA